MYNTEHMQTTFFQTMLPYVIEWGRNHGIKILFLLIIGYIINAVSGRVITRVVQKLVVARNGMSHDAEEKREQTLIRILFGTARITVWLVVVLMILSEVGINIGPLIAGAGVVGLAVGFGGQYLIKDIITGLFIILENQYRVGDAVELAGLAGKVEDISLRVTTLRDLDGIVHHIPHGSITTVSNKSMNFSRMNVNIGISYTADIDMVKEIINEVGLAMSADEQWGLLITKAPEFLRVEDLGDSAVILKVVAETRPGEQWAVAGEFRKKIKQTFDAKGIEIPFPQMVVHNSK